MLRIARFGMTESRTLRRLETSYQISVKQILKHEQRQVSTALVYTTVLDGGGKLLPVLKSSFRQGDAWRTEDVALHILTFGTKWY